ncbi:DUF4097 family beta strand repeat-containing protein [uncultured Paraglaciecola sp.]|uniref:DUF4097 family beta strand repeat-containing protein n=1 Tax=uncultured Paraglaciecola sp. TaxID=1765024 RepID=UPI0030DC4AFC|tara:strand:+ start:70817 stop:71605 length:789 start_codon:yes stop_codon:yes gene_type:complete
MKITIKPATYLSAVVLYFILFYSTSLFAKTFSDTFNVNLGGQLNVQTDTGSIRVATHDETTIELRVKIENRQGDEFAYRHELIDGNLTIIGEIEHKKGWVKNLKVEFDLLIPKHYNVKLNTSGGSLAIEDLVGELSANTSGGSIKVGNIVGDIKLRTSGGSITTDNISGNIDAHTSGGSINVTIDKQLTKNAKLTTSGGSITAHLISDIHLDIYASTSGGRVKSDFEIDGKLKKRSVKGSINGGGPKLTLKTSGGSIKIKEI